MMFRMRCPWCGHGKMHFGESANLRNEVRTDVFSCRGCGYVIDRDDVEELAQDENASAYREALAKI